MFVIGLYDKASSETYGLIHKFKNLKTFGFLSGEASVWLFKDRPISEAHSPSNKVIISYSKIQTSMVKLYLVDEFHMQNDFFKIW